MGRATFILLTALATLGASVSSGRLERLSSERTASEELLYLPNGKHLKLASMGQAPLIGWLCTIVWGSLRRDRPSLHFALCLAAVWFGCINACREIVKERSILERERLFGLSLIAYVWSRFSVLSPPETSPPQMILTTGTLPSRLCGLRSFACSPPF